MTIIPEYRTMTIRGRMVAYVVIAGFAMASIPTDVSARGALKGAAIGAGVVALTGGSKKSIKRAAVTGAIIGAVSKNKRKKRNRW